MLQCLMQLEDCPGDWLSCRLSLHLDSDQELKVGCRGAEFNVDLGRCMEGDGRCQNGRMAQETFERM